MGTRVMHQIERQYLTLNAQGLLYRFIIEGELDHRAAEDVLNQAISIGSSMNAPLDEVQIIDLITQMQDSDLFTSSNRSYQSGGNRYLIS